MMSFYSTRNVLTSAFPGAIKTGKEKSILLSPNRFSLYTDPAFDPSREALWLEEG
jgi:hypothetical protein